MKTMYLLRGLQFTIFIFSLSRIHCTTAYFFRSPVVNTSTGTSYAEFYPNGHLQFGLCESPDEKQQNVNISGNVCFPNTRLQPSATFRVTKINIRLMKQQYEPLKLGNRNCVNCSAEEKSVPQFVLKAKDEQPYSNLSANHISVVHHFDFIPNDKVNPITGSITINAYIIKEIGDLVTVGDVYQSRLGDTLVKVAVEFNDNVSFVNSVEVRFGIFSLDNSTQPLTLMDWVKDPLKGKAQMPNCWVLFSHKVLLDGQPKDMETTYPRVKIETEWYLTISFPPFQRSASYEVLLRHSLVSRVLFPSMEGNIAWPIDENTSPKLQLPREFTPQLSNTPDKSSTMQLTPASTIVLILISCTKLVAF